ncbi:hypothetical protein SPI_09078 [Niveomyces insectorum RCEF 264]|uniref:HNH nuclease domain-containing protein n=1 Tax=Niveomyces insectorum RCEF 264 TaxID=1081102 RepID=A0A167MAV0_9HYPO|nr:hypothetical protein SPI_09078 [Niveomyces insectorum RCEF 264]
MASPPHRQQAFLEDGRDFPPETPIFANDAARNHAETLFFAVLQRLEANERLATPYRRVDMVRLMHRFSRTQQSKDLVLRSFCASACIDMTADLETVDIEPLPGKVVEFTDYLFANFFLPLKASSAKTPQPTPASLSVPTLAPHEVLPGSAHGLATLRRDCLIRDKHRCVISRKFDEVEAAERIRRDGDDATDDEGHRFVALGMEPDDFADVEVAHILPHSLMSHEGNVDVDKQTARRNALAILDMFDVGVRHLIEGPNVDRPTNALTLTSQYHKRFGSFRTFFLETAEPHTYRIDSLAAPLLR